MRRDAYPMPWWWRRCRDRHHAISILSRRDEHGLWHFCGDCGRGELVKWAVKQAVSQDQATVPVSALRALLGDWALKSIWEHSMPTVEDCRRELAALCYAAETKP